MPSALRLVVAAAILLLVGCGGPTGVPEAAAPSPTPPAVTQTKTAVSPTASATPTRSDPPTAAPIPAALRFTSTTVDGRPFDGTSLAGRPVLLWFWAPWCPTCRGQADEVQAIAQDYDGKVAVIGVGSLSDDDAAIKAFAADAPGPTHLNDKSGEVFRHFEVVQQSSFVLLAADGTKVWSVGYGGSDDLADQVAAVAG